MKKNLPGFSKKLRSKTSLLFSGLLIAATGFGQVVDTIPESHSNPNGFGSDPRQSYTYSTGDVINYLVASGDVTFTFEPVATPGITTSTTAACLPAKRRIQANAFELEMKSTSAGKFVIGLGTSSSTGAIRLLRALYVNGTLLDPANYTAIHTFPETGVTQSTCAEVIIDGLSIPKDAKVTFVFGSSPTSTPQNIRLSYINIFDAALPVRLLSFDAVNRSNGIEVMWKADNEAEGKSYSVERSNNGVAFEELKKIETIGAGVYSYLDKTAKLGPVAYYRLQMISADGEKTYSKIKAVVINGANTLSISPNPVRGNSLNATFKPFTEPTTVKILNISGKVLLTQQIAPFTSQSSINTTGLSKGIYIIQFVNGTEVKTSRFLKD